MPSSAPGDRVDLPVPALTGHDLALQSGMQQSAGVVVYRRSDKGLEVLLVHPSGSYNRTSPWSIPKGVPELNESLQDAALRETEEETGIKAVIMSPLGSIDYRASRKRVFAFAGPSPRDARPRCASWEVDRAEFVTIERALTVLHPDQRPFLHRLLTSLGETVIG